MEKKYNFVYKTVNRENGKYYIGKHSTDDMDDGYIGSGSALKAAIKKYGSENFDLTVLKNFETNEEAYAYEESVVTKEVVSDQMSYNQRIGGSGANFNGAGADALIRREKTKRKKFEDKVSNQKLYCFDIMGRKVKVYSNVDSAVNALNLNGKASASLIRQCASEINMARVKYYGLYWSFTNNIPEKCYLPGSYIFDNQKKKKK